MLSMCFLAPLPLAWGAATNCGGNTKVNNILIRGEYWLGIVSRRGINHVMLGHFNEPADRHFSVVQAALRNNIHNTYIMYPLL